MSSAGSPAALNTPPIPRKTASSRKVRRRDRIARWVITLGGVIVIASVVAILALIVGVTLPLFGAPQARLLCNLPLPPSISAADIVQLGVDLAMDGKSGVAYLWMRNGTVDLVELPTGKVLQHEQLAAPKATPSAAQQPAKTLSAAPTLTRVEPLGNNRYMLVWSDGASSMNAIEARRLPPGSTAPRYVIRTVASAPAPRAADQAAKSQTPPAALPQVLLRGDGSGATTRVAILPDGRISALRQTVSENLLGEQEVDRHETAWRDDAVSSIRALTMDHAGKNIYAGTNDGRLICWKLDDKGEEAAQREVVRAFADKRPVTALALVLGDVSLAVGDEQGHVTTWTPFRADGVRKLRLVHSLEPHAGAVCKILPSGRNKSLLSLDEKGVIHWDHMTSERHLLSLHSPAGEPVRQVALGPRGDAVLALDAAGKLQVWHITGGCPEISPKTLFGKVLYEGYDVPAYVWQTTGGNDFEPKFSLVPLIFGTLKGTFYAMIFAVPIALFGAAYCSYFAAPAFRRLIKPIVEIMATVPSVVIGFLIALWLAPIIANGLLAFFLSLATIPITFILFMVLWQLVSRFRWAKRVENGYEFLVLFPVLVAGILAAVALAHGVEAWCFAGSFCDWLLAGPFHSKYEPLNCIIIAFGLGFTVIPVIFSIAEDSLSNVPYNMTAASMALGGSRWQTLWRVILPSASPGIFAAIMIGFGRAVGETMIVLMATGSTPILSCSPLNGMRTLSANIATEIPEAPVGGTLYRVLFLCAVLLFFLTFTVNTAAELVRQHLRKRYGRF